MNHPTPSQHPEMQLAEPREFAARRWREVIGEFIDEGPHERDKCTLKPAASLEIQFRREVDIERSNSAA